MKLIILLLTFGDIYNYTYPILRSFLLILKIVLQNCVNNVYVLIKF